MARRYGFDFKGKSGKTWNLDLKDKRVAKVVRSIQDLPGQHLFQYLDEDGTRQAVASSDVNDYLREVTGEDVTAKDFSNLGWYGAGVHGAERIRGCPTARRR